MTNNSDILYTFMPSEEMRDHLLNRNLTDAEIMRLILGAPVALQTKAEYCRRLMCRDDKFYDRLVPPAINMQMPNLRTEHSFAGHYHEIRAALEALQLRPGEILCLNEAWLDKERMEEERSNGSIPFLSLEAALRYIRDEMAEEAWTEGTLCWTVLEKWVPRENGEMLRVYCYYLIRDEVVFFERTETNARDHWLQLPKNNVYSGESIHLNLSVPYHPGDIVAINCIPFVPVRRVLLLEVGDDCCGVTCLYRTKDGRWKTGTLKHGRFTEGCCYYSPLYRISSCSAPLPPEDSLLTAAQAYIAGDAEKGRKLWEATHRSDSGLREEDIMRLIEN